MYIKKNICDNLIGTLLNLDGQSKDNKMAQKDCMEMGSMHELHRINRPNQKHIYPLHIIPYQIVKKQLFYKF